MLHRILDAIRNVGYVSDFETYCRNLQRTGLAGTPTADEARKDYDALLLSRPRPY